MRGVYTGFHVELETEDHVAVTEDQMAVPTEHTVGRWMAKRVFTTHPGAVLLDAYEIMQDHRVRHVPVLENGKLVGIVSDRDVRSALPSRQKLREGTASLGNALLGMRISEVMTLMPFTIGPDASIREAAELMCQRGVGALPVVDETRRLVGIISSKDILWAIAEGQITPSRGSSHRPD